MQMSHLATRSANFSGDASAIMPEIRKFLEEVAMKNPGARHLHLVHALVFNNAMTEIETLKINDLLSEIYKKTGFSVLGGDTSSGNELNIFISTIVY